MNAGSVMTLITGGYSDWLLIGVFIVILTIDALRSGSTRATALALALPIALWLDGALPHTIIVGTIVSQFSGPLPHAVFFLVLLVLLFLIMYRVVASYGDSGGAPLLSLLASIACAIILVVVWIQVPGSDSMWQFGSQIQTIFAENYRFFWPLIAYIILAYVRS
jgi:hypothetical protein